MLDPARNFGKPVLTSVGIYTSAVYQAYLAEGQDARRVAIIFETPTAAVDAAVAFSGARHLGLAMSSISETVA